MGAVLEEGLVCPLHIRSSGKSILRSSTQMNSWEFSLDWISEQHATDALRLTLGSLIFKDSKLKEHEKISTHTHARMHT